MKKQVLSLAPLRRWLLPTLLLTGATITAQAQNNVGVGTTTPNASAVLDVSSTTQGLLAPRMTTTQRNAIGSPATGLLVYQTDGTAGFYVYTGTAWTPLASGSGTAGPTGPQGPTGPMGPMGTTGAAGPAGTPGAVGATGPAGPAGTPGTTGTTGPQGATGPKGDKGDVGATGPAGPSGTGTGPAGPMGPMGTAGATGPAGPKGDAGVAGAQGPKGDTGAAGTPGTAGTTGATGPQGPAGPMGTPGTAGTPGTTGATGPAGTTGPTGPAGQGVATGGTAGQVLSKIDATDYNTQWVTPAAASGGGASYEVYATITTAQTTSVGSSLCLPDGIYFGANTTPAVLTGGNTFTNVSVSTPCATGGTTTGSKFTAGTAGLYFVDIQIAGEPANGYAFPGIPMLDYNGTGNSGSSYYGTFYSSSSAFQAPHKGRGTLQRLVYMNAGDYFVTRLASPSTVIGADPGTDGSNYIKIVKLK